MLLWLLLLVLVVALGGVGYVAWVDVGRVGFQWHNWSWQGSMVQALAVLTGLMVVVTVLASGLWRVGQWPWQWRLWRAGRQQQQWQQGLHHLDCAFAAMHLRAPITAESYAHQAQTALGGLDVATWLLAGPAAAKAAVAQPLPAAETITLVACVRLAQQLLAGGVGEAVLAGPYLARLRLALPRVGAVWALSWRWAVVTGDGVLQKQARGAWQKYATPAVPCPRAQADLVEALAEILHQRGPNTATARARLLRQSEAARDTTPAAWARSYQQVVQRLGKSMPADPAATLLTLTHDLG